MFVSQHVPYTFHEHSVTSDHNMLYICSNHGCFSANVKPFHIRCLRSMLPFKVNVWGHIHPFSSFSDNKDANEASQSGSNYMKLWKN